MTLLRLMQQSNKFALQHSNIKLRVLPGVPGANGPPGPQGIQGPQGVPGQDGIGLTDGDKGDITVSSAGSTWTIDNGSVTYPKIQNVSVTARFLGRITAGAGSIEELTGTEATSLLNNFTDTLKGLAPLSGGGTDNFLRADGTWAQPPGTGGADGDRGDIIVSGGGTIWTIDAGVVTLGKLANINTGKLIGRDAALSGIPEEISASGGIEFTGSGAIQTSAFTGDVTKAAGGTVTTIANDAVTYAKMQNVSATSRFLGRITAGAGDTEELTGTQATTLLDAFTSSLKGVTPASGGGTTNYLRADGSWAPPPTGTVPDGDKGDITVTSSGATWTIDNSVVTYAKMQNVSATSRLMGRITAGAGVMQELTGTQATTLLDPFTSTLKGVVTASGGGTTNFLRADGTWVAPPTGTVADGDYGDIVVSSSGTVWKVDSAATPQMAGIELGHVSDTTLSRSSAGVLAVEGVTVPLNATTNIHTAQQIELGHASDTTLSRSSAGVLAVEGVTVPTGSVGAVDRAAVRANGTGGASIEGSVLLIADTTGALSRSGGGGIQMEGTNTNDSATAGQVGEVIESEVLSGSAVSATTAVTFNVTSISLTAGDWDVWATVANFSNAATVTTALVAGITTTSATLPVSPNKGAFVNFQQTFPTGSNNTISVGKMRLSLSTTTTVYLVMRLVFSVNTNAGYGYIGARRAR